MPNERAFTQSDNATSGSLSIVIPVYKSKTTLAELYRQLVHSLTETGLPFEIIFVEDCGGDGSWEVIKDLASRDVRVRGLTLTRNFGQHNALLCGIRAARHGITVTLDDDLQHPPDQIALLLAEFHEGFDVVYGVPRDPRHGLLRNISSRLTKSALQNAMGSQNALNVSAFRMFSTELREAFESYQNPFVSIDVLLSWGTRAFSAVKVRHEPRCAGISNYTFGKLVSVAFDLLTGFSTAPLRLVSLIGFTFTLAGLAILVWVIGNYLINGSVVPGFTFMATIITIYSGVQLFSLGIFGEYLSRIFARTMGKPAYVLREATPSIAGFNTPGGR